MKNFICQIINARRLVQLAIHDGCSPSSYTTSIVALAKEYVLQLELNH